ncbi:hypothetical protein [Parapedobacter koreensis]|nr:hypothetical protein [Parapedobacter koreensis]
MDKLKKAYQFYFDEDNIICTYLNDKWGESNSIEIYDKGLTMRDKGSFAIDPIPFLIGKEKDSTIILEYFMKETKLDHSEEIHMKKARLSKLADFPVEYRIIEGIEGNTTGDKIFVDKIILNDSRDSVFLLRDSLNIRIPLKHFIFRNGNYQFIEIADGLIYYNTIALKPNDIDEFYSKILSKY